jgi:hypothetical protein
MQSTLAGSSWSTVSTNLKGPGCSSGLARGGAQWVLKDLLGRVSRSTDGSGNTVATAIFDMDGVARYGTGTLSSAVIRDTYGSGNEDALEAHLVGRELFKKKLKPCLDYGKGNASGCHMVCLIMRGESDKSGLQAECQDCCTEKKFKGKAWNVCVAACVAGNPPCICVKQR